MKTSLREKLITLTERYHTVGQLMSDPNVIQDQNRYRELGREYAQLGPIAECFQSYETVADQLTEAEAMLETERNDPELLELAREEVSTCRDRLTTLLNELKTLLLPEDPNDERDVYLEIRAGTGGEEAGIFAGNLFRMYSRYAEQKRWRMTVVSESPSDQGGYKEIIVLIEGDRVYSQLKFESGAHRVQRVPATESQGRIHTSACTVAVMPAVEAVDNIEINPSELRIDTFRASGAGGQHVNKTDSAIRITHLPSGIVVECQDERSQHKNRARALSLLQTKLLNTELEKQRAAEAVTRKQLVGSGDRSERIRTYNFPQGRVTDHRINLTLYKLDLILEGELDDIIEPLTREFQAEQLAAMGE